MTDIIRTLAIKMLEELNEHGSFPNILILEKYLEQAYNEGKFVREKHLE